MTCSKAWSDAFLVRHLNASFVRTEYKTHRKELLTQQQISRLPTTMAAAETYKQVKAIETQIEELGVQYKEAQKNMSQKDAVIKEARKKSEKEVETLARQEWKQALDVRKIISDTMRKLQHDINVIKNGGNVAGIAAKEVREFIMPCSKEDCRGFLSTQYKCGICDHFTCAKCFDLIGLSKGGDGHVCKPENVESADLIRAQTKPCPCCGTRISKIDGCDQMWCTQCHKAFSWNTGKIVTGVIHNPHFYQYQREHGDGGVAPRNPGDVPCGGLPGFYELQQVLRRKVTEELMKKSPPVLALMENHRLQQHFTAEYVTPLRTKVAAEQDNEKERVLFIVNEITREELAAVVMRKDNARKKNTAILYVCDLFTTVAIDLFRAIVMSEAVGIPFMKEIVRLSAEYEKLRQYCMEQFKNISTTYGVCVPCISPEWVFSTTKFNAKGDVSKYVERREEQKKQRETVRTQLYEAERLAWTLRRQAMIQGTTNANK